MNRIRPFHLLVAALALGLAGCDLSLPWSAGAGPAGEGAEPSIGHTPQTLAFQGWLGGGSPEGQWLVVGDLPEGVDVRLEWAAPVTYDYATANPPVPDRSWRLTMVPPDQAGPGTHTGTIAVRAFWRNSSVELSGSPWLVPYRYVVGPAALAVTPQSLSVEQLFGGPAPQLELLVDGAAGAGPWSARVQGTTIPPDPWFTLTPASGSEVPARMLLEVTRGPSDLGSRDVAIVVITRAEQEQRIQVTRQARSARLIASEAPVALTMLQGQEALPSFSVRVDTEAGAPVQANVSVEYGELPAGGSHSWLGYWWSLSAPGDSTLAIYTSAMVPGRYTATIRIWGPGNTLRIPVTLDVIGVPVSVAPTQVALAVDASSGPTPPFTTAMVSATTAPVAFTAAASVPWLSVSPAAGTAVPGSPVSLTIRFEPSAMPGMRSGDHAGQVVVRPALAATGGVATAFPVDVALRLLLPGVQAVGPPDDVEGSRAEVAVIGGGLLAATEVRFGALAAPAVRALSATALLVTPPVLPPGSYQVTIPTPLGHPIGVGRYQVHAPVRPAATAFAAPGRKVRLHFDAASGFLWAVNTGAAALERYWAAGGWSRAAFAAPRLVDAVPSPLASGRFEVLADGMMQVAEASALPPGSTETVPLQEPIPGAGAPQGTIALLAGLDGRVLLLPSAQACQELVGYCEILPFDPVSRKVQVPWIGSRRGERGGTSRSGLRMAIAHDLVGRLELQGWNASFVMNSAPALGYWAAGAQVELPGAQGISLDRHGDLLLLVRDGTAGGGGSALFDVAFRQQPGHLPATIAAALLTQGGDVAVAFDGVSRTVRRFDLGSAPDLATGEFPELGPAGGVAPLADPGAHVVLALAADDRTLFLGGDDRIVVVPLP